MNALTETTQNLRATAYELTVEGRELAWNLASGATDLVLYLPRAALQLVFLVILALVYLVVFGLLFGAYALLSVGMTVVNAIKEQAGEEGGEPFGALLDEIRRVVGTPAQPDWTAQRDEDFTSDVAPVSPLVVDTVVRPEVCLCGSAQLPVRVDVPRISYQKVEDRLATAAFVAEATEVAEETTEDVVVEPTSVEPTDAEPTSVELPEPTPVSDEPPQFVQATAQETPEAQETQEAPEPLKKSRRKTKADVKKPAKAKKTTKATNKTKKPAKAKKTEEVYAQNMEAAITEVLAGLSAAAAAVKYGLAPSTLRAKVRQRKEAN